MMSEHPPAYDPQSNGNAEVGVKKWKGMFKTQRSSLEEKIGAKIPARHPFTAWITKWSGDVQNWQLKGPDGLTPYQRVRGKAFRTRLAALGESVQYKLRSHEPLSNSPDGRRWHVGLFLGIDRRTGQYIVHGEHGIKFARTIIRLPDANKWNKEALEKLNVTPQSLHIPKEPEVVFRERPADKTEAVAQKQIISRQVYIKQADIRKFGLTRGCPRCDHELSYGPGRTSRPHSLACRQRIMGELVTTPEGAARVQAAGDRLDRTA